MSGKIGFRTGGMTRGSQRTGGVLLSAFLAGSFLVFAAHSAELKAAPDVLVFHRINESVTTSITLDEQPLPASAMGEIKLWASGHDYDEMFRYEKTDGALILTPTSNCEVGSYDLVIKTSSGNVSLKVYTPLDEMPGTLEKVAASMGITAEELKKRMGLVAPLGGAEVKFDLPEVFYEGQVLELDFSEVEGAVHTWKVNDAVVAQGPDAAALRYVFQKPGLVVVEYTATQDGKTIAAARDTTMVAQVPAIEWKVPRNVEFSLHATPGYGKYNWSVNAKPAGQGNVLTHTFSEPGTAAIECLCEQPAAGPEGSFLRIRYTVQVTE